MQTAAISGDWPVVGRRREVERVSAALGSSSRRGVVLAGPAGSGKTTLARLCVRSSTPRPHGAEWVYANRGTASIPLGAFAPLLPALPNVPSPESLLSHARKALVERIGPASLLAVDDAHLLDDLSAALVHELARSSSIRVVLTMRSGEGVP
ncbi:MAG: ATP-binding protein, partial [Actinobacteria bacterium]|nr:ATP-binding protein [Actinomycetota bacterium]